MNRILNRARWIAAIVAGLALAASFPSIGVAGLAWVAPGLVLLPALGVDGQRAFRLGYVAGLSFFLASLYWLLHIPVFKLAPIAGWMALSAFLALYPATWVWLAWRLYPRRLTSDGEDQKWTACLDRFLEVNWAGRLAWGLAAAALWVALEMMQARFLSGFPWNLLGSSQYRMIPIIQIASFTGLYGVSFLAVWFAVSLMMAGIVVVRQAHSPRRWMWEIILPMLVLIGIVTYGYRASFLVQKTSGRTVRVALVQPSIPQQWIWSDQDSAKRFEQLLQLSEKAMTGKPDLVVWPEAAVPGFVRWNTNAHDAVTRFAQSNHVWLILGADDAEPALGTDREYDVFNASFLVSPRGEFVGRYAKRKLVMFGEYLPFVRWLPFLERWTGMGSFTPGSGIAPFEIPALSLKTSVLICFEDVFPHVARGSVEPDTDFLLNLTNNGWFGESAAQWQHAAAAVFRAVENGLPLVRCANNGLSCWVDASGRMQEVYFQGTEDIYGRGVKYAEVPLLAGSLRQPTFYTRHGDVFGWGCVALAVARLLAQWLSGRRLKVSTK